jgi:hypothetical protein
MSGGTFDYNQYKIKDIYEKIQRELDNMGKEIPKDGLWLSEDYYKKYPEEKFFEVYSEDVQNILKEGIKILKQAEIYAKRIDWFLSGDDGEDSLILRLKEDLKNIV